MYRRLALFTALMLLLTACTPAVHGGGSAEAEKSTADISGASMQSIEAMAVPTEPEPELEPGPVLTQADVDGALARVMENYSAAAVSVATVERGQLSQSGAWGWAVKNEREMTPDTKVRIASISKVVVAMCAMAMVEEEIVDLDAPLSDYWGTGVRNPYSKGQPTARTLMTHTSSIKNLDTTRGLSRLKGLLQSRSSWRSMEPGSGGYWAYSNFGMCVLGTTLELAYGGLLDDYLQEHFLDPMDARASFFGGRLEEKEVATLYSGGSVGRSAKEHTGRKVPTKIGDSASFFPGGFTVSAVDMAKLMSVLINDGVYQAPVYTYTAVEDVENGVQMVIAQPLEGEFQEVRLLSEESVADMETPRFTVDLADYCPFEQCLILRRQEDVLGQDVLYYHTGSAYGVYSLMTYNPDTGNGIVVISTGARRNVNERGMYALCSDVMEILYSRMEGEG